MKYLSSILTSTLFLTSCATNRDSMLLGGAIGASSGAFVGNQIDRQNNNKDAKGTAIGAVSGAAFGALFGFLGHKDRIRKEQEAAAARARLPDQKRKVPGLSDAEVESLWIPAHIENDQYIDGHFIYVIRRNATWKQED